MIKYLKYFILIIFCLTPQFAIAKTFRVEALTPFHSANPPKNFSVKLLEPIQDESIILSTNTVLNGYIYQTIPPKRLKQNASFIYIPTNYIDHNGKSQNINNIVCKYTTKFNAKEIAVNSAYIFGTVPIILITAGIFATQGAVKNSQGEIVKSSAENVYENSPLSLIEKGNYLNINKGKDFLLNFVIIHQEKPNYNYIPAK